MFFDCFCTGWIDVELPVGSKLVTGPGGQNLKIRTEGITVRMTMGLGVSFDEELWTDMQKKIGVLGRLQTENMAIVLSAPFCSISQFHATPASPITKK